MRTFTRTLLILTSTALAFGPLAVSTSQAAALTGVDSIAPGQYGYVKNNGTPRGLTEPKWIPASKRVNGVNQINLNDIKQPVKSTDTLNASLEVNKRSELIAW